MISNEPLGAVEALVAQHRALAIIRLLAGPLNGATNDKVLADALDLWALGCSQPSLLACLRQLEQSGLVTTEVTDDLAVVKLTMDGEEVANGKVRVSGVLHYKVGCPY